MAYLSTKALHSMGFKFVGKGVKVSDKASIYNPESIELHDFARIDDFCVCSGRVVIGRYVHITPMCLLAGGEPGIYLSDFSTLAYGVKIFAQSDDYSGLTMVNSLIPRQFKNEKFARVVVEKQVILGANSVVMPGVTIKEGCAVGAATLINKNTDPWGVYVGSPAKRLRERKRDLLELEKIFLKEQDF